MSDEERLIEAVAREQAKRDYRYDFANTGWHPWDEMPDDRKNFYRGVSKSLIAFLRDTGATITAPPAPEPTYTIRLTEQQRCMTKEAILQKDKPQWIDSVEGVEAWRALCLLFQEATPDREPGE